MTILFLFAILLAIPTSGLSLLAWIVWFFWVAWNKAKEKSSGLNHMRATRSVVEPLVGGDAGEFYKSLLIPKIYTEERGGSHDSQCGRHILNFISHNPEITQAFMEALKFHRLKGSASLPTAIEAIEFERGWQGGGGPIHHICYFSIATLTSQNRLTCFDDVDIAYVTDMMTQISGKFPGMMDYAS